MLVNNNKKKFEIFFFNKISNCFIMPTTIFQYKIPNKIYDICVGVVCVGV